MNDKMLKGGRAWVARRAAAPRRGLAGAASWRQGRPPLPSLFVRQCSSSLSACMHAVCNTPLFAPPRRSADLFWLLERIMPRLHERAPGKPVHVLGIADPASIPQVRLPLIDCSLFLSGFAQHQTRPICTWKWAGQFAQTDDGQPLLPARCLHSSHVRCCACVLLHRLQLVTYGCDTFDSCYPTRVGRHGTMLTRDGPLRVVS